MSDYCLEVVSFPAGFNVYTGNVQGGHAYAKITFDYKTVVELEHPVDAAFLATLEEDDRRTYRVGDMTARLTSEDEARDLAVAWMKRHAPNDRLVWGNVWREAYGEVIYAPASPTVDGGTE